MVPSACLPVRRTASMARSRLRTSLSASKTRKTSMPFSADLSTKRSTTVSS